MVIESEEGNNSININHQHDSRNKSFSNKDIYIVIGIFFFILPILFTFNYPVNLLLFIGAYLLIGGPVLLRAGKNILMGQIFDENFLMSIATLGALLENILRQLLLCYLSSYEFFRTWL